MSPNYMARSLIQMVPEHKAMNGGMGCSAMADRATHTKFRNLGLLRWWANMLATMV